MYAFLMQWLSTRQGSSSTKMFLKKEVIYLCKPAANYVPSVLPESIFSPLANRCINWSILARCIRWCSCQPFQGWWGFCAFRNIILMENYDKQMMTREGEVHTKRPKAWKTRSEVPPGLLRKYFARSMSSSLLYRNFLSGGGGRGASPASQSNSCLCRLQNFIQEALEWCGALLATSFQKATTSHVPWDLNKRYQATWINYCKDQGTYFRYVMNFIKKFTSSWVNATPLPVVLLYRDRGGVGERFLFCTVSTEALAAAMSNRPATWTGAGGSAGWVEDDAWVVLLSTSMSIRSSSTGELERSWFMV